MPVIYQPNDLRRMRLPGEGPATFYLHIQYREHTVGYVSYGQEMPHRAIPLSIKISSVNKSRFFILS